jgi:hypothetical protein
MLGLRVILGTFEAGPFPSAVYLLSLCYTRCTLISKLLYFFAAIPMYTELARRQMADPQPNSRLQLRPYNRRPKPTRIGSFTRGSMLQRLPHCRWLQCESRSCFPGRQTTSEASGSEPFAVLD